MRKIWALHYSQIKTYSRYHNQTNYFYSTYKTCSYRKVISINKFLSYLFACQCTFYQYPQLAATSIVLEDRITASAGYQREADNCKYTVLANFDIFLIVFFTCVSVGTITEDSYFQYFFFKIKEKTCIYLLYI